MSGFVFGGSGFGFSPPPPDDGGTATTRTPRGHFSDFALANPIYSGAEVAVYTVDPVTLTATHTLAPLYSDLVSATELSNPQNLDGEGKWQQPVYIAGPCIAVVSGAIDSAANTATGIHGVSGGFQGDWVSGKQYFPGMLVRDGASGYNSSGVYYCDTPHVSGVFATDLAAGLWLKYLDAIAIQAGIVADALANAQNSADAAAASQAAAAISAIASAGSQTAAGASATAAAISAAAAAVSSATVSSNGQLSRLGLAYSSATVLSIDAGTCAASTPGSPGIALLAAMTKSIAGAWVAGSGNGGMGVGLTATLNTWYHVFAITVAGLGDVYFDTSSTAFNAPAGTTAFRRIGSIKLDASVHILPFIQNGDWFDWVTPVLEFSGGVGVTTGVTVTLVGVPLGVPVRAILTGTGLDSAVQSSLYLSSLAQADLAPSIGVAFSVICPFGSTNSFWANVMTNLSAQIRRRSNTTTQSISAMTIGWMDVRGRG